MVAMKCRELPKIALNVLKIPASSGETELIFSNWKYIYYPNINRFTFERFKKIHCVLYSENETRCTLMPRLGKYNDINNF